MTTLTGRFELLPANHPTVLRRLVRECNDHARRCALYATPATGDTFRPKRVRLSAGVIEAQDFDGKWHAVNADAFGDGNGNVITASRTRCGH